MRGKERDQREREKSGVQEAEEEEKRGHEAEKRGTSGPIMEQYSNRGRGDSQEKGNCDLGMGKYKRA